jgi:hypothetical protein
MLKVELADLVKQTKLVHYIKEESKIKKDLTPNPPSKTDRAERTHPLWCDVNRSLPEVKKDEAKFNRSRNPLRRSERVLN